MPLSELSKAERELIKNYRHCSTGTQAMLAIVTYNRAGHSWTEAMLGHLSALEGLCLNSYTSRSTHHPA